MGRHNERMRDVLAQYRGREMKTTGDGVMAILDGTARAILCASRMVEVAPEDGIEIRAAVHTGEIGIVADDLRGVAVHEAVPVLGVAQPSEVLVTDVTKAWPANPAPGSRIAANTSSRGWRRLADSSRS